MTNIEVADNINLNDLEIWEIAEMYDFDDAQEEILKAALDAGFFVDDAVEKIINYEFELVAGVTTYEELGYHLAEKLDLPDFAYSYFDFERFGAEMALDVDGYLTRYGLLTNC